MWETYDCKSNAKVLRNAEESNEQNALVFTHPKLCGLDAIQTLGTPIHSKLEMPYAEIYEFSLEYFHLRSAEKLEHLAFLYKRESARRVLHSI